eukprot:1158852-Pelagomonas_calceolata.AAC.1
MEIRWCTIPLVCRGKFEAWAKILAGQALALQTALHFATKLGRPRFRPHVLGACDWRGRLTALCANVPCEIVVRPGTGADNKPLYAFAWLPNTDLFPFLASFHIITDPEHGVHTYSTGCSKGCPQAVLVIHFQFLMLVENVSPAADQPEY